MPKIKLSLSPKVLQWEALVQELSERVDPQVKKHWDWKVSEGNVPTDIRVRGPVDMLKHSEEELIYALSVANIVNNLFQYKWKNDDSADWNNVYYCGIGTGKELEKIAPIANAAKHKVIAIDTSEVSCQKGREVLAKLSSRANAVLLADITVACQRKYIPPQKGNKFIISRVLEVLDKQEPTWRRKLPQNRKMAKTAVRIGRLFRNGSIDSLLLVSGFPEENKHILWGDGNPEPLEKVVGYMEKGAREKLGAERVTTVPYHGQVQTIVLIERE